MAAGGVTVDGDCGGGGREDGDCSFLDFVVHVRLGCIVRWILEHDSFCWFTEIMIPG
jgi:hypothetical protein